MKINFDDGSFLSFIPSDKPGTLTMVMCGIKDSTGATTMSSTDLTANQVADIVKFFVDWVGKLE